MVEFILRQFSGFAGRGDRRCVVFIRVRHWVILVIRPRDLEPSLEISAARSVVIIPHVGITVALITVIVRVQRKISGRIIVAKKIPEKFSLSTGKPVILRPPSLLSLRRQIQGG
jgi:hypothetical protein